MNIIKGLVRSRLSVEKRAAIRLMLNGARALVRPSSLNEFVAGGQRNVIDALSSKAVSPDDLIDAISVARHTNLGRDRERLSRLVTAIFVRPEAYRLLDTSFFRRKFVDDPGYVRLVSAYRYGCGEIDPAVRSYADLYEQSGELLDLLLAAHCLMRPAGREIDVLELLKKGEARFLDEPLYFVNLATAYFVVGQTDRANAVLRARKGIWEDLLGLNAGPELDLKAEIAAAIRERRSARKTHYDETIYTESAIWAHWAPYYADMVLHPEHLMFGWLSRAYESYLEGVLAADPSVDCIVDFGVMCAKPHHSFAMRHPNLPIFGVDRQRETAKQNAQAFGDASNLSFHAKEIEKFLSDDLPKCENGVLFHARTATLCYPEKLRNLYLQARQKGIRHVILFENVSISRSAGEFLNFDDFPEVSITFKNHQFIHNYKKLLDEAGFNVIKEERLFSPLVSPFSIDDLGSVHVAIRAELR